MVAVRGSVFQCYGRRQYPAIFMLGVAEPSHQTAVYFTYTATSAGQAAPYCLVLGERDGGSVHPYRGCLCVRERWWSCPSIQRMSVCERDGGAVHPYRGCLCVGCEDWRLGERDSCVTCLLPAHHNTRLGHTSLCVSDRDNWSHFL